MPLLAPSLPIGCPAWEYKAIPGHDNLLVQRNTTALAKLATADPREVREFLKDTRPFHGQLFRDLTPEGYPYYAGNYRGQHFHCLKHYTVRIASDPRVGHSPDQVWQSMVTFASRAESVWNELAVLISVPRVWMTPAEKLVRSIEIAVALFVYFLEIHPYANGNGHAARIVLIALLSCYGVRLSARWPIHPRPNDPPYSDFIQKYRSGQRVPLVRFVLDCI